MATTSDSSVSFDQTDTRSDEMNSTIEQWIDDLVTSVRTETIYVVDITACLYK